MSDTNLEVLQPSAIEAISRAEVDMSISTARRFPRQLGAVKQKMTSFATLDMETAEGCFYSLPRGGKTIQGPSVRLAEIAVACYQNLRAGTRVISTVTQGDNPHVVVQAVATDLENNISISIEKRRRITKKRSKDTIDEDDINLAANACSSIAFRDAVFRVVPMALVKPVYEAARKVAIGDAKTLADRRARCLDTFAKMGISKDRVLTKLEKKTADEIDLGDIEMLIGLHNAIKEGEVSLDDAFPTTTPAKHDAKQPEPPAGPKLKPATTAPLPQDAPNVVQMPNAPQAQPDAPQGDSDTAAEAAMGLAPEQAPAGDPDQKLASKQGDTENLAQVKLLAVKSGITYDQIMAHLHKTGFAKEGQGLSDLAESKLASLAKNWAAVLAKLSA